MALPLLSEWFHCSMGCWEPGSGKMYAVIVWVSFIFTWNLARVSKTLSVYDNRFLTWLPPIVIGNTSPDDCLHNAAVKVLQNSFCSAQVKRKPNKSLMSCCMSQRVISPLCTACIAVKPQTLQLSSALLLVVLSTRMPPVLWQFLAR